MDACIFVTERTGQGHSACVHSTFSLSPHPLMDACIFVIERTGGQGCSVCVCVCVCTHHACLIHSHTDDAHVFVTERTGQGHSACVYTFFIRSPTEDQSDGRDAWGKTQRKDAELRTVSKPASHSALSLSLRVATSPGRLMRTLKTYSFSNFQIRNTGVWTTVTALHCTLNPRNCFIPFDPLHPFCHPPPPPPLAVCSLYLWAMFLRFHI